MGVYTYLWSVGYGRYICVLVCVLGQVFVAVCIRICVSACVCVCMRLCCVSSRVRILCAQRVYIVGVVVISVLMCMHACVYR